jgi:hypothetical protein
MLLGSQMTGVGCAMPILIVLAIFGGRWLDALLGTTPWLMLASVLGIALLGLAVMLGSAYQAAQAAQRDYLARRGRGPVYPDTDDDARQEES